MKTPLATLFMDARLRLGISQAELAERIGFAQSRVAEIESGKSTFWLSKVPQVAQALGVSEEAVKDAHKATRILKIEGRPPEEQDTIKIKFTPLEYRSVLRFARSLGLETDSEVSNWLRRKVLDFLAEHRR